MVHCRDMIRAIRACKTAAEERAVVRKESAAIRAAVSENDQDYSHRNLAKLMFIHMLGYPTHFGQMECLKLIASAGFPEKRIGYLGLMLLLDERQEVLMLVTNSLKQDLNHSNQYIVGLALCALGNICSAEMARDLAPEVERLLQFRDPNIRKKAALCSIRIIRKVPELAENFTSRAAALLSEKHHGVLITGVQLCTDLCKVSTEALEYFRKYTEGLVKTLKDVGNSSYSPEYDIAGITDPFLHIRLLRLLRVLGQGDIDASDCMNDILAQVATKTESNKNAGNAILYECVETIMSIEDNGGLRVLAINILGRFLSNRDNNIRYVALNMLMKAITVDAQAVQRHRATILECVKDSDASIRKRALDLVFLLVNDNNVKSLTKELIEYLEVSEQEFKGDLTAKICSIVEKFSPEKIWYIDQMLKVLSEAGNLVKDEVWHALIVVISNASDLHGYTVRSLYRAFQKSGEQESLVRVAVWCIGEYGEMLVNNVQMLDIEEPMTVTEFDAVDVIEIVIKRHSSDITTRAMSLIALLKLSSRFPSCSHPAEEDVKSNSQVTRPLQKISKEPDPSIISGSSRDLGGSSRVVGAEDGHHLGCTQSPGDGLLALHRKVIKKKRKRQKKNQLWAVRRRNQKLWKREISIEGDLQPPNQPTPVEGLHHLISPALRLSPSLEIPFEVHVEWVGDEFSDMLNKKVYAEAHPPSQSLGSLIGGPKFPRACSSGAFFPPIRA
ncbi:hypothetical protein HHK36_007082 [Tetracentron sinense]|uniref:Clathrin/coatomer adaptor adaptin-like N-terminal domain-containing protein n=1 Tax=Tetracentron sinense TaxID=13715 RepID=A0A835DPU0_TETSI|nr:hypothetical protein HHK36_007082 [Tetracentron sinense]